MAVTVTSWANGTLRTRIYEDGARVETDDRGTLFVLNTAGDDIAGHNAATWIRYRIHTAPPQHAGRRLTAVPNPPTAA
jgi:hypothetical protein